MLPWAFLKFVPEAYNTLPLILTLSRLIHPLVQHALHQYMYIFSGGGTHDLVLRACLSANVTAHAHFCLNLTSPYYYYYYYYYTVKLIY